MTPSSLMIRQISPKAAFDKLLDTCARSEISTGEARQKLLRWGVAQQAASQIIASLVKARYIDDARFAGAYVRDKARHALWGPRKIALSLRQKGVAADIIADALEQISPEDQLQALTHVLEVKTKSHPSLLTDHTGRAKLYRLAMTRGFSSTTATAEIKALSATMREDT